jgi:MtN3 and saliva related transmembrane protein
MTLAILTTIMGVLMSLGYYPQAYRMFKRKSAEDVSLLTFLIFAIGNVIWLLYGVQNGDPVIILGFGVGVVGAWLVVILWFIYRKKL